MKKFNLIILGIISLFLTSCNFTEEITFNDDGSGEFIMYYDMGEVMTMLKEMKGDNTNDEQKSKTVTIDSTMYFKELLVEKKDSIATLPEAEQKQLKALETIVIKMKMNEENNDFVFGFGSTFKSLDELPEVFDKIKQAKELNSKNNPQAKKMTESNFTKASDDIFSGTNYSFDGKTFSRKTKKKLDQNTEKEIRELKAEMEEMEDMKDFFSNMTYNVVYNFPKKIKSVSNKRAKISDDGKTVTIEKSFIDLVKSPMAIDMNIVLED